MSANTRDRTGAWHQQPLEFWKRYLHYDQSTGRFTRINCAHKRFLDVPTGTTEAAGYLVICAGNKKARAHRLAWLFVTGEWPAQMVDHKNGDRVDNRFSNLRLASASGNRLNQHQARSDSKVGMLGVAAKGRQFVGVIQVNGKHRYVGRFATPEQAREAVLAAKRVFHANDFFG